MLRFDFDEQTRFHYFIRNTETEIIEENDESVTLRTSRIDRASNYNNE